MRPVRDLLADIKDAWRAALIPGLRAKMGQRLATDAGLHLAVYLTHSPTLKEGKVLGIRSGVG